MKRSIFSLLALMLVASACNKQHDLDSLEWVRYYANTFAYNVMNTYYLWVDEESVSSRIANWKTNVDPREKVLSVLYSADKWTKLYEDYSGFEGSLTGNNKTFGLEVSPYLMNEGSSQVFALVNFTYDHSPATLAGLKRGDDIRTVNGMSLNKSNYKEVLGKIYSDDTIELGLADGRTVKMTAIQMYENPVQTAVTLETDSGKKVGYLHFPNFTLDAGKDLETVFARFKADGIRELVLDLRYNTGGYIATATCLASMIAPPDVVNQEKVFLKDIYNSSITESNKTPVVTFAPEYSYTSTITGEKVTVRPADVNPGISHLWVLVSGSTASASEAVICGLKPYMDVTLVGRTTYGKYCGGVLIKAIDWFDAVKKDGRSSLDCDEGKEAIPTWGINVITSRYADCNGVTLSMPAGIDPDITMRDKPSSGTPLGDPAEELLAAVLDATKAAASPDASSPDGSGSPLPFPRPGFGVLLH